MKKALLIILGSLLILFFACDTSLPGTQDETPEEEEGNTDTVDPLTAWEEDVVGTWYYYSSTYSEYRCITFDSDRTACYFEISSLSSTATKSNVKNYTDWYIDSELTEGVYKLYVLGDYTGDDYWAGYQWDPTDDRLEGYDGVARYRTETIPCD